MAAMTALLAEPRRLLLLSLTLGLCAPAVFALAPPAPPAPDAAAAPGAATPLADLFALRLITPWQVRHGARTVRVRVQAYAPHDGRPAAGVDLRLELARDREGRGQEEPLVRTATTGREGGALFDLPVTAGLGRAFLTVTVTGSRRGFSRTVTGSVTGAGFSALLATDKHGYQPGQTVHIRALCLDDERRPVAGRELKLLVVGQDEQTAAAFALRTSRFGIAQADWRLAALAREGTYRLTLNDLNEGDDFVAMAAVEVRRYELPRFAVLAQPAGAFTMLGDAPRAEIAVRSLLGEPIARAAVKIYRRRDAAGAAADASPIGSGLTGPDGRVLVDLDLAAEQSDLRQRNSYPEPYEPYSDIDLVAVATHPLTAEVQRSRFRLRLSRDAVHVHVFSTGVSYVGEHSFVTTSYPDGRPAECDVELAAAGAAGPSLARLRTNRFGIARLELPARARDLLVRARDAAGRDGELDLPRTAWGDRGEPPLTLTAPRHLLHPGEPLTVEVAATRPFARLVVEVERNDQILASRILPRIGRRKSLVFPYQPAFRGPLGVHVFLAAPPSEDLAFASAELAVLYPDRRPLAVAIRTDRRRYRPGEIAALTLQAGGRHAGAPAAFGIAIVDRAVVERERSEGELAAAAAAAPAGEGEGEGEEDEIPDLEPRGYRSIAGWSASRLRELDPNRPYPQGLDLVAAAVLVSPPPLATNQSTPLGEERSSFKEFFAAQLGPFLAAVEAAWKQGGVVRDVAELRSRLARLGCDPERLRDPWGTGYRFVLGTDYDGRQTLAVVSAGWDRTFDTRDDFTARCETGPAHLAELGRAIDRAVRRAFVERGRYLAGESDLAEELARDHVDFARVVDPWGERPRLEADVTRRDYVLRLRSGGPDHRFEAPAEPSDDIDLWTVRLDYSETWRKLLASAAVRHLRRTGSLPCTLEEVRRALAEVGADPDGWRDPRGHAIRFDCRRDSAYGTRPVYDGASRAAQLAAVTEETETLRMFTVGRDGLAGTEDDEELERIVQPLFTRTSAAVPAGPPGASDPAAGLRSEGTGSIRGTVRDAQGSALPGVTLTLVPEKGGESREAVSDVSGRFSFGLLPADAYWLLASLEGFAAARLLVEIDSGETSDVNLRLRPSALESIIVTASAPMRQPATVSAARPAEPNRFTPRLRQDFPETLLWVPELVADRRGRVRLPVPLADSMTTWRVAVLASTLDGRLGRAAADLQVVQPLAVDLDLPPSLTAGDQLAVPLLVDSRSPGSRRVELSLETPAGVEAGLGAAGHLDLGAQSAGRLDMPLRFTQAGTMKLRARARGGAGEADAVERSVGVRPDGLERAKAYGRLLRAGEALEFRLAPDLLAGSARLEVRLYAGFSAHLANAARQLRGGPRACAEQQISIATPDLLAMAGASAAAGPAAATVRAEAAERLGAAVAGLSSFRDPEGGFAYWPGSPADLALTAYVVQFLAEAGRSVPVDPQVLGGAVEFLAQAQRGDGLWDPPLRRLPHRGERGRALSAWIAHALSVAGAPGGPLPEPERQTARQAAERALASLAPDLPHLTDPYPLACAVLAYAAAGRAGSREAGQAAERLRELAHEEAGGRFWDLQSNSPFAGWGNAGRLETTALAVQALLAGRSDLRGVPPMAGAAAGSGSAPDPAAGPAAEAGLVYLLLHKRPDGGWTSTQATAQVLRALAAAAHGQDLAAGQRAGDAERGRQEVPGPAHGRHRAPLEVDLDGIPVAHLTESELDPLVPWSLTLGEPPADLAPGRHVLTVRGGGAGVPAAGADWRLLEVVVHESLPWSGAQGAHEGAESGGAGAPSPAPVASSPSLALSVDCSPLAAPVGEAVTCQVHAERVGFAGYGMLIAEIGLPPRVEVDRQALDAFQAGSWDFSGYEVWPDRLVAYLWPRAGGLSFPLTFRPRLAMRAKSLRSVLYDGYNPEARVVVPPRLFEVRAPEPAAGSTAGGLTTTGGTPRSRTALLKAATSRSSRTRSSARSPES
jgi:hypothetical protein